MNSLPQSTDETTTSPAQPAGSAQTDSPVRLAYLVSHPIQYQAPLLRRIAREPGIDLTVFFGSDFSVRSYKDKGFGGVGVKWDIPLVEGYRHEFLPTLRDNSTVGPLAPINRGILRRLRGAGASPAFDALWVHGYASFNSLHAILAARALGIPVLVRAESWLGDRERSGLKITYKRLFFRALRHLIDGVLPIGQLNTEYWRHYLGPDFPAFLMPYAVDNDYFYERSRDAQSTRSDLQGKLNLDPTRPVILFASKLQPRKRCADLIEAWRRLSPSPDVEPHPYLVIVGDGEERPALERAAQATGFSSIRFCGFRNQSELPRFFDLCSVFVLPSRHEPWGLVVNEVMNAARPVILSNEVGCQRDLITPGIEGEVFPAGDIDALTSALRRTLTTPETTRQMGQRALDRIRSWNFEQDILGLRTSLASLTHKVNP